MGVPRSGPRSTASFERQGGRAGGEGDEEGGSSGAKGEKGGGRKSSVPDLSTTFLPRWRPHIQQLHLQISLPSTTIRSSIYLNIHPSPVSHLPSPIGIPSNKVLALSHRHCRRLLAHQPNHGCPAPKVRPSPCPTFLPTFQTHIRVPRTLSYTFVSLTPLSLCSVHIPRV